MPSSQLSGLVRDQCERIIGRNAVKIVNLFKDQIFEGTIRFESYSNKHKSEQHSLGCLAEIMDNFVSIASGSHFIFCCQFWNLVKLVSTPSTTPALFGGGLLGYVMYDVTHYYLHHAQPTSEVPRNLKVKPLPVSTFLCVVHIHTHHSFAF